MVGLGEEAKREGIGQRRLGFLTWAAAFICHSEEKRTTVDRDSSQGRSDGSRARIAVRPPMGASYIPSDTCTTHWLYGKWRTVPSSDVLSSCSLTLLRIITSE